ncbi:hypothetical protein DENSPDRAFT_511850 [Dentipellis sp. KUC8613]|nr:hypothetical protein DENSPDRAFT_511850 [Dentipellis sp. KUC8613]
MHLLHILCTAVSVKLMLFWWMRKSRERCADTMCDDNSYSYVGHDHPLRWSVPNYRPVRMTVEETVYFQMRDTTGSADAEWASLYPGGGVVYLGDHYQPYTVSMLHQLRCLDIVRKGIVERINDKQTTLVPPTGLQRHCINYLRQMVLCRADTHLEDIVGKPETIILSHHRCMDWESIYLAAQENREARDRNQGAGRG